MVVTLFLFQAEDGIRNLVRSRGLGDVYKRQDPESGYTTLSAPPRPAAQLRLLHAARDGDARPGPVSYTHLTLPTSDLV